MRAAALTALAERVSVGRDHLTGVDADADPGT